MSLISAETIIIPKLTRTSAYTSASETIDDLTSYATLFADALGMSVLEDLTDTTTYTYTGVVFVGDSDTNKPYLTFSFYNNSGSSNTDGLYISYAKPVGNDKWIDGRSSESTTAATTSYIQDQYGCIIVSIKNSNPFKVLIRKFSNSNILLTFYDDNSSYRYRRPSILFTTIYYGSLSEIGVVFFGSYCGTGYLNILGNSSFKINSSSQPAPASTNVAGIYMLGKCDESSEYLVSMDKFFFGPADLYIKDIAIFSNRRVVYIPGTVTLNNIQYYILTQNGSEYYESLVLKG